MVTEICEPKMDLLAAPTFYLVDVGAWPDTMPIDASRQPSLLVSYYYWDNFKKIREKRGFRDYCLDSGGFTAHTKGKTIDLDAFIEFCQERMANDSQLREIFCLDAISDWKTSKKNVEKMWNAGVPAMPVFHVGEPFDVLKGYAKDYPKISLGGMVGLRSQKVKVKFIEQCFARVWPKPIHGLGIGSETLILKFPWHSTDASNWCGAQRFGGWNAFRGTNLGLRGKQNWRAEIEHDISIEARARSRWTKEMAQFDHLSLLLPKAQERAQKNQQTEN